MRDGAEQVGFARVAGEMLGRLLYEEPRLLARSVGAEHLAGHAGEADLLRAIAHFAVEREY